MARPPTCNKLAQAAAAVIAIAALLVACDGRGTRTANKVAVGPLVVDPEICTRLVSSHFGATYFPGMARTTKATKIATEVVACDLHYAAAPSAPAGATARIELLCGAKITDDGALAAARAQYRALGVAVPSLGKLAYAFGPGDLQFWDDDSTCSARLHAAPLGDRLEQAARDLAAELGPQAAIR